MQTHLQVIRRPRLKTRRDARDGRDAVKQAFAPSVEADLALQRFAELRRRGQNGEADQRLLDQLTEELATAIHELQASSEELREQHERLLHSEIRLSEERRRYQELFEFGPDGYLVTTATGVIREANRMAAKMLGITAVNLFSKPL